jgi:hypothetical protein
MIVIKDNRTKLITLTGNSEHSMNKAKVRRKIEFLITNFVIGSDRPKVS